MEEIRPDQDEIRVTVTHRARMGGIGIGTAIVLSSLIIVVGLWGGKFLNDEIEARRIKAAFTELTNRFSAAAQERQLAQQEAERLAALRARAADRARKQAIWNSRDCRFWWDHDPTNPAVIRKARTMQSCQGGF